VKAFLPSQTVAQIDNNGGRTRPWKTGKNTHLKTKRSHQKTKITHQKNKIVPLFAEHRKFHFCMDSSPFCHYRFFPWSLGSLSYRPGCHSLKQQQTNKPKKKKDPFKEL
jgi:hypothetical protein